jgi:hypothetical protein
MEFIAAGVDPGGVVPASYSLAGANEALSYVLSERESDRSASVGIYVFQAGKANWKRWLSFSSGRRTVHFLSVTLRFVGTVRSVGKPGPLVANSGDELFVQFRDPTPPSRCWFTSLRTGNRYDGEKWRRLDFNRFFADMRMSRAQGCDACDVRRTTVVNFDQRQVVREVGTNEVLTDFEVAHHWNGSAGFSLSERFFQNHSAGIPPEI